MTEVERLQLAFTPFIPEGCDHDKVVGLIQKIHASAHGLNVFEASAALANMLMILTRMTEANGQSKDLLLKGFHELYDLAYSRNLEQQKARMS